MDNHRFTCATGNGLKVYFHLGDDENTFTQITTENQLTGERRSLMGTYGFQNLHNMRYGDVATAIFHRIELEKNKTPDQGAKHPLWGSKPTKAEK